MNETLNTIGKRFSCRKYTAEKLSKEQLEALALAAVQSPSGMNRQPWEVYVVTNPALLADMEESAMAIIKAMADQSIYQRFMDRGGKVFYDAPCMLVVAAPEGSDMDCGIVSENIALAASSMGLGNVICGMARMCFEGPRGGEFAARIGFEEGHGFAIAVLVGHAVAEAEPHTPDTSKIHYVE